ncbi:MULTISPECIES: hypothetical protein [Pseudomonadota]|uniref:hypothetical protein n=1 Tax=Pseudomonadota TaxID=1224 RepID=UPI002FEB962B
MKKIPTLLFVLRWYGLQFLAGIVMVFAGAYGYMQDQADNPDSPYQSVVGMLGPWPYIAAVVVGALFAGVAWWRGSKLRAGR